MDKDYSTFIRHLSKMIGFEYRKSNHIIVARPFHKLSYLGTPNDVEDFMEEFCDVCPVFKQAMDCCRLMDGTMYSDEKMEELTRHINAFYAYIRLTES